MRNWAQSVSGHAGRESTAWEPRHLLAICFAANPSTAASAQHSTLAAHAPLGPLAALMCRLRLHHDPSNRRRVTLSLQLLAPLVKSGLLSQDEMNAGLDKALAALPDDLDALKAEIASRAAA